MNKVFTLLLFLFVLPSVLFAQSNPLTWRFGINTEYNYGLNVSHYHVGNTSNNGRFGIALGVLVDFPLTTATGLRVSADYTMLSFYDKNTKINVATDEQSVTENLDRMMITQGSFRYATLQVLYRFNRFQTGVQVGIPVGGSVFNCRSESPVVPKQQLLDGPDYLNVLVQLRAGLEIPLAKIRDNDLSLMILGSVPLTQHVRSDAPTSPKLDDNFRILNISAGMIWLF